MTLLVILLSFVAIYLYLTKTFNYWKQRGVKYVRPVIFFGSKAKYFLQRKSITELAVEHYRMYPIERVVGAYRAADPELMIRDPALARRVLSSDFVHFYRRGLGPHSTALEPMMRNLFFADGDLWRLLRQRLTPAFTSGKLRAMFPLIVERAERLQARVLGAASATRALDARDLMARYTTDFIGACGFGLEAASLDDDDSEFRKLGSDIFDRGVIPFIFLTLKLIFPNLFKRIKLLGRAEKNITAMVKKIMQERNYEPSERNDFIDLMLKCKKKGVIRGESIERASVDGTPERIVLEMTDELIAAQVLLFFAAGFESSSSSTGYTLHELAFHLDVQKRVQEEIDRVLAKHGHKLSYDAIQEMTYLEWTFKEGLRLFPPLGVLCRRSVRQYTFPELNLTIDEGVRVLVPVQAFHNDPKYFENPSEFRPERFHPDAFGDGAKQAYMPFGDGNRACIGTRMAMMQSLAGLAAILSRFTVEPAPCTRRRPELEPKSRIVQSFKSGLPLTFRIRKDVPHII